LLRTAAVLGIWNPVPGYDNERRITDPQPLQEIRFSSA
jgi:hypothetical protein